MVDEVYQNIVMECPEIDEDPIERRGEEVQDTGLCKDLFMEDEN